MDEQGALSKSQMKERNLWDVEKGTSHIEGLWEHHQSIQEDEWEGQGPLGIESVKGYQEQQEGFLQV